MQVILKEDVSNLGKAGDVVNVRDGYGRNDGQAFQAASGPVCSELLHFDEVFEDCPKVVTMTRTCVNNDDPVPPAEEPATEPAAGATGAPPSDPH